MGLLTPQHQKTLSILPAVYARHRPETSLLFHLDQNIPSHFAPKVEPQVVVHDFFGKKVYRVAVLLGLMEKAPLWQRSTSGRSRTSSTDAKVDASSAVQGTGTQPCRDVRHETSARTLMGDISNCQERGQL